MRPKPKATQPGPSKKIAPAILLGSALLATPLTETFAADVTLPPISVGAGMRTSFTKTEVDGAAANTDDFLLDSIRLYVNGSVTDKIKFTFNTEYTGDADNKLQVMDAIARFEFSDQFNIWAGRFLPPSDRSNLYGPYYANNWAVYNDGVQDGFPSVAVGRDDGVAYWGQFGVLKVSAGVFDVPSTMGSNDVLTAERLMVDLWDAEGGYYLNGTYYGEKDLLAFGVAAQQVKSDTALSGDFLLEKNLHGAGAFTIEAEYTKYDGLGGYGSPSTNTVPNPDVVNGYKSSDGYYVLGAYVLPQPVGPGKMQVLAKFGKATYDYATLTDVDQKTMEFDVNYLIKPFNARVSVFYLDTKYSPHPAALTQQVAPDSKKFGLGIQLQM